MANCMLTPELVQRMIGEYLPDGATCRAWTVLSGDIDVLMTYLGKQSGFVIWRQDLSLSWNDVVSKYKALVDDFVVGSWELADGAAALEPSV